MSLSLEQMLGQARREQADIARYAARRERFLDALDWDAMPDSFAFETSMDDEAIDHDRVSAAFRVAHLEEQLFLSRARKNALLMVDDGGVDDDPDIDILTRSTPLSRRLAHELAGAHRSHAKLVRFADRREDALDAIDWSAMTEDDHIARAYADDEIACELAFSSIYIDHLEIDLAEESPRWTAIFEPLY